MALTTKELQEEISRKHHELMADALLGQAIRKLVSENPINLNDSPISFMNTVKVMVEATNKELTTLVSSADH